MSIIHDYAAIARGMSALKPGPDNQAVVDCFEVRCGCSSNADCRFKRCPRCGGLVDDKCCSLMPIIVPGWTCPLCVPAEAVSAP